MKIKIKKTTEEEIEIDLPLFWKSDNGNLFHKQLNEKNCYRVSLYDDWGTSIGIAPLSTGCHFGLNEITEAEYNEAFDKALKILTQ